LIMFLQRRGPVCLVGSKTKGKRGMGLWGGGSSAVWEKRKGPIVGPCFRREKKTIKTLRRPMMDEDVEGKEKAKKALK